MTYLESLKLFNLKEGYTESEIQESYKKLMRKYHPDLYINKSEKEKLEAEEKCKKINEARKILKENIGKNRFQKNNFNSNTTNINFEIYKMSVLQKMSKYAENSQTILKEYDFLTSNFYRLSQILESAQKIEITSYKNAKTELEYRLMLYKAEIISINKLMELEYFKQNGINVKVKFNYDIPIKRFYDNLKIIGEKYGQAASFKRELESIIKEYKGYCYYENIKIELDYLKSKAFNKAKNRGFQNTDDIIVELHVEINEAFENYTRAISPIEKIDIDNLYLEELIKLKNDLNENIKKNIK